MRYLLPLSLAFTVMSSAHAMDATTQGSVLTLYATSQVTTGPFDSKLVRMARDDAAAFVASDGRIRGARLQAALDALRARDPQPSVDDLELAQAILVQRSTSTHCSLGDAPCVNR